MRPQVNLQHNLSPATPSPVVVAASAPQGMSWETQGKSGRRRPKVIMMGFIPLIVPKSAPGTPVLSHGANLTISATWKSTSQVLIVYRSSEPSTLENRNMPKPATKRPNRKLTVVFFHACWPTLERGDFNGSEKPTLRKPQNQNPFTCWSKVW